MNSLEQTFPGGPANRLKFFSTFRPLGRILVIRGQVSAVEAVGDQFRHPQKEANVVGLIPEALNEWLQEPLHPPSQLLVAVLGAYRAAVLAEPAGGGPYPSLAPSLTP